MEAYPASSNGSNRYALEAQVAGGSATEVYLARGRQGERCVIKRVRGTSQSDHGRRLVATEARALGDIQHPNVVALIECIEDEVGPIALVCEHLSGPSLAMIIADRGPLPWPVVVDLVSAAVRGLAGVHRAGYLHLDVTPANIICVGFASLDAKVNRTVKLIDFGLARRIAGTNARKSDSDSDSDMGTPGYVAPERMRGEPADPRSDLYSVGAIAFELLTGRPPFREPGEALEGPAPRLVEANPAVVIPTPLEQIVARLLEADPSDRPGTADEVLDQLTRLSTSSRAGEGPRPDVQLASLVQRVRDSWLTGVLDASTKGLTLIPQSIRVTSPTGSEAAPLEARLSLAQVFERASGRLQITAPAGYGKTVQTLKLLRWLLDEHQRRPERPVPVMISMSEWRESDDSLAEFLIRQLVGKYAIAAVHARRFVEQGRIVALLDGLDEVRADRSEVAVRAIDLYLSEDPGRQALVNFRSDIQPLRPALAIDTTVELCALERGQTARYLAGEWQRLGVLLEHDIELERLSHTPLMLQLMRVSTRDEGFAARPVADGQTVQWLFRRYVASVLAGPRRTHVDEGRLVSDLGRLGATLRRCNRTMLVFEELQPSALSNATLRRLYLWGSRTSVAGLVTAAAVPVVALSPLDNSGFEVTLRFAFSLGVMTWVVAALGFIVWPSLPARVQRSVPAILGWGAVLGAVSGLGLRGFNHVVVWVFALEGALICATLLGVSRRARSFPDDDITTVEYLRWDFRGVAAKTWALLLASASLLLLGFRLFEPTSTALEVSGIVLVLGAAIVASRHGRIEDKVTPKLGLHRSIRSGSLAAGLGFVVGVLALGLAYELGYAALGGLFVGVVGGLWFGGIDMINHAVLRVLLALDRSLGLRPSAVLDDAVHLGFLRRVGNGYMFAHSSLRDHFAAGSRAS